MADAPIEGVVTGEMIIDTITARKEEIRANIEKSSLYGQGIGLEFKLDNSPLSYRGKLAMKKIGRDTQYSLFAGDNLQLLDIFENGPSGVRRVTTLINVMDIDMDTFNVISTVEVDEKNKKDIERIMLVEKQGKGADDLSELIIKVDDNMDDKFPVPIVFQHTTVDSVVPLSQPILADTLITEMPEQKDSSAFVAKKKELEDITTENKDLLEGSKLLPSIEKVLAKDTQSELKARYDALKETIKAPVAKLNKTLESNLVKIAAAHNSAIRSQVEKTIAATKETRRKYKLELQKTRKQVADRLAGKSKGQLGLLKSSKLQNLEKSLSKDESEIDRELGNAKRYVGVKETLLKWVRNSNDKTKLTEEQIETIAEALKVDEYENACFNFINNLNGNTMEIIALILRELREQLSVFKTSSPHNYPAFKNIVIRFINSLIIMSQSTDKPRLVNEGNVEDVLSQSIDIYEKNDGSYFTPMTLFDIKERLIDILDDARPVISEGSESEKTASTSSSTTSTSIYEKKREEQKIRALEKKRQLDTLTPAIEEVKMVVSEYIPNIQPGEVLLTTAKQIKSFLGKKTGEIKEKHYYLDVNGKVKKIGSNMIYKLYINADGTIPSQLAHLGAVKRAPVDSLSGTKTDELYDNKDQGSFFASPFEAKALNLGPPMAANVTTPSKAPESPAPRKSVVGNLTSLGKGFLNRIGARTSRKTPVEGGKHRTRKFRKIKTHKKHSRR